MKVIGLTGKAGSGKDTVARLIYNTIEQCDLDEEWYLEMVRDSSNVLSLAYPIYSMVGVLIQADPLWLIKNKDFVFHGLPVRKWLQKLGTEFGRNIINENIWIDLLDERIKQCIAKSNPSIIIIPDVRFDNEADYIRSELGGEIWHIYRESMESVIDDHVSESGITVMALDNVVFNTSTIEILETNIKGILAC
jgi:hypothetical protein